MWLAILAALYDYNLIVIGLVHDLIKTYAWLSSIFGIVFQLFLKIGCY